MTVNTCICRGLLPTRTSMTLCWSVGEEKTRIDRHSGKYICFYSERIWDTRRRNGARLVSYRGINNFRNMYIEHRVILLYIVLDELFSCNVFQHFDYVFLPSIFCLYIFCVLSYGNKCFSTKCRNTNVS